MNSGTSTRRRYRCAVYTRKSHEEGLDQDFNSLDAQREACEAYILSQAGLGWELVDKQYDDGGISGGHLERPGIQDLLSDIRAGQIDVVVVYKVDRLTRSITDFGKLVETFDAQEVSFVSVTQAFNTTNSMGRLTLNVLLSFAQFEREVTAERIRDKIAGSKQKGMWMGGRVPYGYRNENKQLYIQEEETIVVRLIFKSYIRHKNTKRVKVALDRQNIVTRIRVTRSGRETGGLPFSTSIIRAILTNPIYIGKIRHKDKVYSGNHEAIIDQDVWEEVQSILASKRPKRGQKGNTKSPALLNGLIFDDKNNRLITHHVNKKGSRYYYYVSKCTNRNKTESITTGVNNDDSHRPHDAHATIRLPMKMIEAIVKEMIIETLTTNNKIFELLNLPQTDAGTLHATSKLAGNLAINIQQYDRDQLRELYQGLIKRITIFTDKIEVRLQSGTLFQYLNLKRDDQFSRVTPQITKHIKIRRRGQELKLIIGGLKPEPTNVDHSLIKLIARAHLLKHEIETGTVLSIKEFADKYKIDHGDAKNLIPLCYLAPSIIEAILAGTQPSDLTSSRLKAIGSNLPIRWNEQMQLLGFAA